MPAEQAFADTNLFLRYLTDDVPEQADAVERLLERAAAGEVVLATSAMVIAELVWTLESHYRLSRDMIAEKVLAILNTPGLAVESSDLLLQAVVWYADKNVDFIDAYNAAWMRGRGLTDAWTFDARHFKRFEHLTVRVPGARSPPPHG